MRAIIIALAAALAAPVWAQTAPAIDPKLATVFDR
jgi:hypothetical protein